MPTHVRRPGLKRHRVDIQEYILTQNLEGGSIRTWSTVATWWAEIQPKRGLEKDQADQVKSVRTHRIYMRYFTPGISEEYRVLYGSRIFQIVAVINPGERGCDTILDLKEATVNT